MRKHKHPQHHKYIHVHLIKLKSYMIIDFYNHIIKTVITLQTNNCIYDIWLFIILL